MNCQLAPIEAASFFCEAAERSGADRVKKDIADSGK